MSAVSDKYEKDVAEYVNKIPGVKAERPPGNTAYADVKVTFKGVTSWMEVKMNHTDNLSNPRVFYKDGKWSTTYDTPSAKAATDILNSSPMAKKFLADIAKFSGIPLKDLKIPTTKSGLREEGAVPLHVMKKYFSQPSVNRYIANSENMDLGKIVTDHYTKGKAEPAYYMQAGDDFYRISNRDPFKLGMSIPLLSGNGDFKVRVSTRTEFYEVQAEIKIKDMPNSKYSVKPGTKKLNPFLPK
jgi:hypothetical protein